MQDHTFTLAVSTADHADTAEVAGMVLAYLEHGLAEGSLSAVDDAGRDLASLTGIRIKPTS